MTNKKKPHLTGQTAKQKAREEATRKARQTAWAKQGHRRGRQGEQIASWLLRLKNYRIIARNQKMRGGEIDIIARRGKLLVFVEVKARGNLWLARQAVVPRQWHRIEKAAAQFVAANPQYGEHRWRFDLIALANWRLPLHIKAAWRHNL